MKDVQSVVVGGKKLDVTEDVIKDIAQYYEAFGIPEEKLAQILYYVNDLPNVPMACSSLGITIMEAHGLKYFDVILLKATSYEEFKDLQSAVGNILKIGDRISEIKKIVENLGNKSVEDIIKSAKIAEELRTKPLEQQDLSRDGRIEFFAINTQEKFKTAINETQKKKEILDYEHVLKDRLFNYMNYMKSK